MSTSSARATAGIHAVASSRVTALEAPDLPRLGIGRDLVVGGRVGGCGLHQPRAIEVRRLIRALMPGDPAGFGEFGQPRRESGGDHGEVGAGCHQSVRSAGGDVAAPTTTTLRPLIRRVRGNDPGLVMGRP